MSRRSRPAFWSAIELASLIRASVSRPFSLPYGVRPTPVIWLTEDLRFSAVARGFRPPSDGGLGRRPAILHGRRRAPADAGGPAVFVTWPLTNGTLPKGTMAERMELPSRGDARPGRRVLVAEI